MGGGGTLKFLYIRRHGLFFLGSKFEFQYFWGLQKNKKIWGYEDFVDMFWGSLQNWPIFRGHFYAFQFFFLKGKVQNGGYFWQLLKFKTFFWVLEIPDIFLGRTVDAGPEPTYTEKK